MINKNGQQEMVGFVLIVILVVIGLVVYLVIKAGSPAEVAQSITADNIIQSVMMTSSPCIIKTNSYYETIDDLAQDCYNNKKCATGRSSCEVLNETLKTILDNILNMEQINAYELNYSHFVSNESSEQKLLINNGICSGTVYGSEIQSRIISGENGISLELKLCMTQ